MLIKCGCTVHHVSRDADIDMVKNAILSSKNCTTTVVGEDTDLLILFLYHVENYNFKLYFRNDISRGLSKNPIYDIIDMQVLIGNDISKYLLYIHAYTGSDTTSRIFSIGKSKAMDKLIHDQELGTIICKNIQFWWTFKFRDWKCRM